MSWKTLAEGLPEPGPVIIAYRHEKRPDDKPEVIGAFYYGKHVGTPSFVEGKSSGYPFFPHEVLAWHPMPAWP